MLVVESQDDSRQIACDMLSLLGHQPCGVTGLKEAEQALAATPFDTLMFADDVVDDGAARRLAAERQMQLVLVRHAGASAAADDGAIIVRKPYSMEKLRAATAASREVSS